MKKQIVLLLVLCCLLTACAPSVQDREDTPTVPVETESVVKPLPTTVDVAQLEDCTVAVSLKKGGLLKNEDGSLQMDVTVYTYDLYDLVDIAGLKVGSAILIGGETVTVEKLETLEGGAVMINGGLDAGGYELCTNEDGVYFEVGFSDVKSWYEVGKASLPVSADFVCTDSSDLDKEPVILTAQDLLKEDAQYDFNPRNTTVVIEGGVVTAMERIYTP